MFDSDKERFRCFPFKKKVLLLFFFLAAVVNCVQKSCHSWNVCIWLSEDFRYFQAVNEITSKSMACTWSQMSQLMCTEDHSMFQQSIRDTPIAAPLVPSELISIKDQKYFLCDSTSADWEWQLGYSAKQHHGTIFNFNQFSIIYVSVRYMSVYVCSLTSVLFLFATLWMAACQTPLCTGLSRQEYWSWLPSLLPGDLPNPGNKPMSLMSSALADKFFTAGAI